MLLRTQPTGACCKVGEFNAAVLRNHYTIMWGKTAESSTCAPPRSTDRKGLLQRETQPFEKLRRNSLAGTAVHKHCDSKRKNNPFTHLCRGMWEGFKVEQIVLANTGMENAPFPPVETIPKLAANAAASVGIASLSPSNQIQITFRGYFHYCLMLWSPKFSCAVFPNREGKETAKCTNETLEIHREFPQSLLTGQGDFVLGKDHIGTKKLQRWAYRLQHLQAAGTWLVAILLQPWVLQRTRRMQNSFRFKCPH